MVWWDVLGWMRTSGGASRGSLPRPTIVDWLPRLQIFQVCYEQDSVSTQYVSNITAMGSLKPGSYFLRMQMLCEFWCNRATFAKNVLQELSTSHLLRIICCELVTSKFVSHSHPCSQEVWTRLNSIQEGAKQERIHFTLWSFHRYVFKGSGYFFQDTRHNFQKIYNKLTGFEDYDIRKLPLKYHLLRCCSFWEMSKTSHKNNFSTRETNIIFACINVFPWHCFNNFSKTTAPQQIIF